MYIYILDTQEAGGYLDYPGSADGFERSYGTKLDAVVNHCQALRGWGHSNNKSSSGLRVVEAELSSRGLQS